LTALYTSTALRKEGLSRAEELWDPNFKTHLKVGAYMLTLSCCESTLVV